MTLSRKQLEGYLGKRLVEKRDLAEEFNAKVQALCDAGKDPLEDADVLQTLTALTAVPSECRPLQERQHQLHAELVQRLAAKHPAGSESAARSAEFEADQMLEQAQERGAAAVTDDIVLQKMIGEWLSLNDQVIDILMSEQ